MKEETREKILDELERIGTLRPKAGLTYALAVLLQDCPDRVRDQPEGDDEAQEGAVVLHPRLQHLSPVHGHRQRIRAVLPKEGNNEASQAVLRHRGRLSHGKDRSAGGIEKHHRDQRVRPPEVLPRLLSIRPPGSTARRLFPVQVPRQRGRRYPRLRQPREAHREDRQTGRAFSRHRQAGAYDRREDP